MTPNEIERELMRMNRRNALKLRLRAAMTELREAKKYTEDEQEVVMIDDMMHTLSRRVRHTSQMEIPVNRDIGDDDTELTYVE